jgi:RNA polymerase subunit RPABC4/transcription elongation factor Spt4
MALITCPECQRQVSNQSEKCVHCGGFTSNADATATAIASPGATTPPGRYPIGTIILVIGLALVAYMLDVPGMWLLVGLLVVVGIRLLSATKPTKQLDPLPRVTSISMLRPCDQCGHRCSIDAYRCPNCGGFPITGYDPRHIPGKVIGVLLTALMVYILYRLGFFDVFLAFLG